MVTKISKHEALIRIATAFTISDAHNDDSNQYHVLAVSVAYALWMITNKDCFVTEYTLETIEREVKKL